MPREATHLLSNAGYYREQPAWWGSNLKGFLFMTKILSADILDILPIEIGFIIATKEVLPTGEATVATFVYDQEGARILPIKIHTYLECKFGAQYRNIATSLGDYITCTSAVFKSGGVVTLYPNGEISFFDEEGALFWSGELIYQDSTPKDIALDGTCFWSTVPDKNAIIRYSPVEKRVLLRIGGGSSTAFNRPISITKADDKLYICNEGNYKIRTIRLEDYAVKDYAVFNEPVYKYFRVGKKEYALLASGIYCINDEN